MADTNLYGGRDTSLVPANCRILNDVWKYIFKIMEYF
jgi:hypothetical protein